ncbi:MAG TPA: TrbG/VirB9 family P-type conjugative transfer protein [Steroidobacteraceae bacterium]|nr:TrbG/VirB9 family P-type conjugative transfer protein [Steroidobacteraceae bacterium]
MKAQRCRAPGPLLLLCMGVGLGRVAAAAVVPQAGPGDSRVRVARYAADQVYQLHGYVGYQIDLEFEPGESFLGLASGDIEALSFVAQGNHLFLKPRAPSVGTNITILTDRREYQIDYSASEHMPPGQEGVVYVLRFIFAPRPAAAGRIEQRLDDAADTRPHNSDYWYCGPDVLRPVSAWDDGVQTRLTFGDQAEIPAIFVRNEDGSESLVNFSVEAGDVVIHRVAPALVLRRGALTACVVNKGYRGAGQRLPSGTVAPGVERVSRGNGT